MKRLPVWGSLALGFFFLLVNYTFVFAGGNQPVKSWPLYNDKETIVDYAKRVGLEPTRILDLGSGVKMEFVLVPAGSFMMGGRGEVKQDWEISNEPVHRVTFREPFYIGKHEVTVAQFHRFAEATGYRTTCEKAGKGSTIKDGRWQTVQGSCWKEPGFPQTPEHPVGLVSCSDADAFAKWLSERTGCNTHLPTEAQWEYASRGPKNLDYPWGNTWDPARCNHGDVTLKNTGFNLNWEVARNDNDGHANNAPVGAYPAGASWCGALDMAGNVWEWCRDWSSNYPSGEVTNPQGPAQGQRRISRGGSIDCPSQFCLSSYRIQAPAGYRQTDQGFRMVVEFVERR